ncbi:RNA-binding protein [Paenibacillus sp. GD4]|uniref:RNA-binding protein n=1 Tax=Paenibacillus sp. GD4 TaxID=3068890 RepID=UPI002796B1A7|nr:RNA-binding protein [Paenibacillus sp. GD4]MDQ1909134.1 RNA-binding protein [Paenibacillus sp. GD4]
MITRTQLQAHEELWHLPDYQFVTHCFEVYGLNRGIYNTMDEWLYRFGIREVVQRRQTIAAFLSSPHLQERGNGRYLKFGKGGLTKQLYDFVQSSR